MKNSLKQSLLWGAVFVAALMLLNEFLQFGFGEFFDFLFISSMVVLVTIFVEVIIHELGHVLCGALNNYSFVGLQILWLAVFKDDRGYKISLIRKPTALGMAIMIPNGKGTEINHKNYYMSGIIANAISIIPLVVFSFFYSQYIEFFVIAILIVIIIILTNAIPSDREGMLNDGYLARLYSDSGGPDFKIYQELQVELLSGTRPRDLEIVNASDSHDLITLLIDLFMYYKGLDSDDLQLMSERIDKVIKGYKSNIDLLTGAVVYELIYYYAVVSGNPFEAQRLYQRVESMLEMDYDINGRRILAYYSYFMLRDSERAQKCIAEGLEAADSFPIKGIAIMEKKLLNDLNEVIRKENLR